MTGDERLEFKFICQGILTAMEALCQGFKWVLGNGNEICATKDQWLRIKHNFGVENSHHYAGRNEKVADYFLAGTKQ